MDATQARLNASAPGCYDGYVPDVFVRDDEEYIAVTAGGVRSITVLRTDGSTVGTYSTKITNVLLATMSGPPITNRVARQQPDTQAYTIVDDVIAGLCGEYIDTTALPHYIAGNEERWHWSDNGTSASGAEGDDHWEYWGTMPNGPDRIPYYTLVSAFDAAGLKVDRVVGQGCAQESMTVDGWRAGQMTSQRVVVQVTPELRVERPLWLDAPESMWTDKPLATLGIRVQKGGTLVNRTYTFSTPSTTVRAIDPNTFAWADWAPPTVRVYRPPWTGSPTQTVVLTVSGAVYTPPTPASLCQSLGPILDYRTEQATVALNAGGLLALENNFYTIDSIDISTPGTANGNEVKALSGVTLMVGFHTPVDTYKVAGGAYYGTSTHVFGGATNVVDMVAWQDSILESSSLTEATYAERRRLLDVFTTTRALMLANASGTREGVATEDVSVDAENGFYYSSTYSVYDRTIPDGGSLEEATCELRRQTDYSIDPPGYGGGQLQAPVPPECNELRQEIWTEEGVLECVGSWSVTARYDMTCERYSGYGYSVRTTANAAEIRCDDGLYDPDPLDPFNDYLARNRHYDRTPSVTYVANYVQSNYRRGYGEYAEYYSFNLVEALVHERASAITHSAQLYEQRYPASLGNEGFNLGTRFEDWSVSREATRYYTVQAVPIFVDDGSGFYCADTTTTGTQLASEPETLVGFAQHDRWHGTEIEDARLRAVGNTVTVRAPEIIETATTKRPEATASASASWRACLEAVGSDTFGNTLYRSDRLITDETEAVTYGEPIAETHRSNVAMYSTVIGLVTWQFADGW